MAVYDILGREVAFFDLPPSLDGVTVVRWGGTDRDLNLLSSGLYYCRVVADGITQALPLLLLR
jgi:hypothetical protein